jgi:hypothetical protein
MTYRFRAARTALARDPGHLPIRDRAVLRILNRAGAATVAQLTILAYSNRRLAQARLRRLWEWGYLERTTLPPAGTRGGAPLAYRLAPAAALRLGYQRSPWRGPGYLAHTLDAVEACALVAAADPESGPRVLLWLPESIATDALPSGPLPDAIAVLAADGPEPGAIVLCLEIDEGNQHAAPIRDKLIGYRRSLNGRPGWHALFIVPTAGRAAWLRRLGARLDPPSPATWVTTLEELRSRGTDAHIVPLAGGPSGASTMIGALPAGPPRSGATPVGSPIWLELLGSGGSESTERS